MNAPAAVPAAADAGPAPAAAAAAGAPSGAVAVVAGTGDAGTRLVRTMPYWVSGIGYPDLIVFGADMLDGNPQGVRAAGFFGNDWSVENGEIEFPEGNQP